VGLNNAFAVFVESSEAINSGESMSQATFQTNPRLLSQLLAECHSGAIQLPDFQRSWVWDIDRIVSLIASVSRSFPVGALMALESGGDVQFKPRRLEGAPAHLESVLPSSLLLDGQQRMTSLYQVTLRGKVVETETIKHKPIKRWFFIDIAKALDSETDREDAIIPIPEDFKLRSDFGRRIDKDLETPESQFEHLMFPLTDVFDSMAWFVGFTNYWAAKGDSVEMGGVMRAFNEHVLTNFTNYQVPVITLSKSTSKEAVCVVFEKVNTGGKPLDAFELITAMYAADNYQLRDDWYGAVATQTKVAVEGIQERFQIAYKAPQAGKGILADVGSTDFFHVVSLFHTRALRQAAVAEGKADKELPQITGKRQALLNVPLESYQAYKETAEKGFMQAAKFLQMLNIYRVFDLPYQSQVIPLAAILADLGDSWEHAAKRAKLVRWYWNGVFGELYGSTTETRIAKDFVEVIDWINNEGPEPSTVSETTFRADRLKTMRMRLSAAYKGMNALMMKEGAKDFRSGQQYGFTIFFNDAVDIHHIFPQDWCKKQGIDASVYDSIINKTPLSARTNRIIGGVAPSEYLAKLERGTENSPPLPALELDSFIATHLAEPSLLRSDDFAAFMIDRQEKLVRLIELATGKAVAVEEQAVSSDWAGDLDEEFMTAAEEPALSS
jgi:hypothetical protein